MQLALLASECPLETLSMRGQRGCALQSDLVDLLYEIGNNSSLRSLDVSGHESGDAGARYFDWYHRITSLGCLNLQTLNKISFK